MTVAIVLLIVTGGVSLGALGVAGHHAVSEVRIRHKREG